MTKLTRLIAAARDVSDDNIGRQGEYADLREALRAFDGMPGEPTRETVEAAVICILDGKRREKKETYGFDAACSWLRFMAGEGK